MDNQIVNTFDFSSFLFSPLAPRPTELDFATWPHRTLQLLAGFVFVLIQWLAFYFFSLPLTARQPPLIKPSKTFHLAFSPLWVVHRWGQLGGEVL
jgi:hypothetical protein